MVLKNQNIICLSSSQWDSPTWVNPQHLMYRLSRYNRILYVEPISMRFPSTRKSDLSKIVYRIKGWFRGTKAVKKRLWVYSPIVIPLHHIKPIRILNRLFLKMSLRTIQKHLHLHNPILWIFLPTGADLIGSFGEKFVIYHCVDQYSANPGVNKESITGLEQQLLKKADLVFTTSQSLYKNKKVLNKNTFYLPNVADVAHFKKALKDTTEVPEDLKKVPSPIAGFWGAITGYKIDLKLIAFAADELPGVSFVLVGPVGTGDPDTDISLLESKKNIYLFGPRDYKKLPGYLKGFDICFIPFKLNETTQNVFPMKFFEYLSGGKPVVSTNLPSLRDYSSYCYLARDSKEFVQNIKKTLKEKEADRKEQRIRLAEKNSWEINLVKLSHKIESILEENQFESSSYTRLAHWHAGRRKMPRSIL